VRLVVLVGEVFRLLEVTTGLDEALLVYPDALAAVEECRADV
jgi:hypothetical protein